jgi:hypothetical protein
MAGVGLGFVNGEWGQPGLSRFTIHDPFTIHPYRTSSTSPEKVDSLPVKKITGIETLKRAEAKAPALIQETNLTVFYSLKTIFLVSVYPSVSSV